jgi:predicted NAD-dependent protein-ADP-ribosyltransferase YbiA (DUF1768 family)
MIYRTSDDGRKIERVYEGQHPHDPPVMGRRLCAFVELGWDDTEQGFNAAEAALQRLSEIVEELHEASQNKSGNAAKTAKADGKWREGIRFICNSFNDGHRMIYRTSDDGRKIKRVYEGDHPRAPIVPGRIICAFIEIGWNDTAQGFDAEKAGLQRLLEIVRELRAETQNGARDTSRRRKATAKV